MHRKSNSEGSVYQPPSNFRVQTSSVKSLKTQKFINFLRSVATPRSARDRRRWGFSEPALCCTESDDASFVASRSNSIDSMGPIRCPSPPDMTVLNESLRPETPSSDQGSFVTCLQSAETTYYDPIPYELLQDSGQDWTIHPCDEAESSVDAERRRNAIERPCRFEDEIISHRGEEMRRKSSSFRKKYMQFDPVSGIFTIESMGSNNKMDRKLDVPRFGNSLKGSFIDGLRKKVVLWGWNRKKTSTRDVFALPSMPPKPRARFVSRFFCFSTRDTVWF